MQSKKDYIKAPSFDQKKNEPRPRNFDKIQHRFNVASSQLKYRVEKENVVTNESIPEVIT